MEASGVSTAALLMFLFNNSPRFCYWGIFSENLFKKFCRLFVSWLICSCDVQKESPIDPYEILLFLVSMIMFRGDAFLSDPFFSVPASGRSMHPPGRSKGFPTPIILQTGGITNKVCPFISEKIMRNVKKILSSLLLSVMCYTIS